MIDVREAPAGQAVDMACAEAMGWEYTDSPLTIGNHAVEGADRTVWFFTKEGNVRCVGEAWNGNWQPSNNIAAAWKLVEAMRQSALKSKPYTQQHGEMDIHISCSCMRGFEYTASFGNFTDRIVACTAELAICRMFLLACHITAIQEFDGKVRS